MNTKKRLLVFRMIAILGLSVSVVFASAYAGTATATGVVKKNGTFARIGKSAHRTGKVTVVKVTITDLFGREREVTNWKYVGGKGSARPTIKFTGDDKPKKSEHVSIDIETQADAPAGGFPLLDLFLY